MRFAEDAIQLFGKSWMLALLCSVCLGGYWGVEEYTSGTLVLHLQDAATHDPLGDVSVVLGGMPYRTDGQGSVEYNWGWLGGGRQD